MYTIGICDDCQADVKKIKDYIKKISENSKDILIYEYQTGEQLLKDRRREHDLLFIDMKMPGIDGNKAAAEIRKWNNDAVIVFCSGLMMPTPESIRVQPFRYLLKQSGKQQMLNEIGEILQEMVSRSEVHYIFAIYDGGITKINIDHIIYAANYGRYTKLYITNAESERFTLIGKIKEKNIEFIYKKKLAEVYQEIEKYGFEYAHNSYIVNFRHVIKKDKNILKVTDDYELNCSRARERNFKEKFIEYLNHSSM